jgi:Spy/CpxP family protein refolding chaperone
MKTIIAIVFVGLLVIASVVTGQEPQRPPQPPHPPNPDPLAHLMFPPEMIMGHARELNLTDEQKAFLRSEVQKATVTFQDLQWKLQDQMEALHDTMKSTSVNEQQALAQLDKVLDIERDIKRLHIALAVRLKNRLTAEQQEQLHKMMDHHPEMPEN